MRPKANPVKGLSEILFVWLVSRELRKSCVPMQSASLKTGPVARSTLVTNSPRLLTFTQDCFVSILFVILSGAATNVLKSISNECRLKTNEYRTFYFFCHFSPELWEVSRAPSCSRSWRTPCSSSCSSGSSWSACILPCEWKCMISFCLPLSQIHSLPLSFSLTLYLISLLPPFLPPDQSACQMHVCGWTSSMHACVICLPLSRMKYSHSMFCTARKLFAQL